MAQETELIRRAKDLLQRCEQSQTVTHSSFLTPAEQYEIQHWADWSGADNLQFRGGFPGAERQLAFFLPDWFQEDDDPAEDILTCVKITAGFGTPGHRDYLGSILGLGIKREWVGDILIKENVAYVLCLRPIHDTILSDLTHVSRYGVRCEAVPLSAVPAPERSVRKVSFTVQSSRLDAIVGSVFGISRSHAARLIAGGAVSLNYAECLKNDATVKEGDVLSVRGYGKAKLLGSTGKSRKGRTFLEAERYV